MRKLLKKSLALFGVFALNIIFLGAGNAKTTVFVIGDSTASEYNSGDYPRMGWAQVLGTFFNSDSVLVDDHAASGRSSKSFYDEGRWTTVYNSLKPGDFVIMQFAHNDGKSDEERHTDPQTTYKDYLNIFISGAVAKGAFPILVSSIPRNYWQKSRNGDYMKQSHDDYTEAMKQVAEQKDLPFVDMELSTRTTLTERGEVYSEDSIYLNLQAGVWPNYPDGRSDDTHLQEKGAYELSKIFLNDLKVVDGFPELDILKRNIEKVGRVGAMPKPDLKGTITGAGLFPANTEVTLTARPVTGFVFDGWSKLGSDEIISKDGRLTITTDTANVEYIANFGFPAGINDIASSDIVQMFPNPAKDVVHLNVKSQNWNVKLMDLKGAIILTEQNKNTLNVSNLSPGVYIIHIQTEGENLAGTIQVIP